MIPPPIGQRRKIGNKADLPNYQSMALCVRSGWGVNRINWKRPTLFCCRLNRAPTPLHHTFCIYSNFLTSLFVSLLYVKCGCSLYSLPCLVMSNQRFFKIICFRFPTNVPKKIEHIRFWNKIYYRTKTFSFRFQNFRSKSIYFFSFQIFFETSKRSVLVLEICELNQNVLV